MNLSKDDFQYCLNRCVDPIIKYDKPTKLE